MPIDRKTLNEYRNRFVRLGADEELRDGTGARLVLTGTTYGDMGLALLDYVEELIEDNAQLRDALDFYEGIDDYEDEDASDLGDEPEEGPVNEECCDRCPCAGQESPIGDKVSREEVEKVLRVIFGPLM